MFQLNASNVFGLAITYLAFRTVYHLYLSPLAKFPGPKLAAISRLYELYHDGYRSGGYICKLRKLHEQYGIYTPSRMYQFLTFEQAQSSV